jgi:ADP-heptose:LPS heptosyltransferase
LAPLFRLPGARLFSLQKAHAPGALERLQAFGPIVDLSDRLTDFAETGAAARAMDCVVSVDTSVAHLAGALGLRVLTMVTYSPDWRWQLNRSDSPWYPGMILVRQSAPGDWRGVVDQLATILKGWIDASRSASADLRPEAAG